MSDLANLKREAVRSLREIASRAEPENHGLRLGAKASRHLAWIESEHDWGKRWRQRIEARAADIAIAEKQDVLYNYHVCQALIELFNEDPTFRETMHAKVTYVMPKRRWK